MYAFIVWCKEEKYEENMMNFRNSYLGTDVSNLVFKVWYMKALKYVTGPGKRDQVGT